MQTTVDFLVSVSGILLALVVFNRSSLLRFIALAAEFLSQNHDVVILGLAVLIGVKLVARPPRPN